MTGSDRELSVIIPTFHRRDELFRCLERLSPDIQSVPGDVFEVLVGDDASSPSLREELSRRFPSVRYVAAPGRGPATNRNTTADVAKGRYLLFADDDCVPSAGWMNGFRKAIAQSNGGRVFEGRVAATGPRSTRAQHAPLNDAGGYLWSCNFCIEAELFRSLKGFCEEFTGAAMEDVELQRRITLSGARIEFVPEALVVHPWRLVSEWSWFRMHGDATETYLRLHPEERRRLNTRYHILLLCRRFVRDTLPALAQLDWRGVRFMLLDHIHSLKMAYRLRRT